MQRPSPAIARVRTTRSPSRYQVAIRAESTPSVAPQPERRGEQLVRADTGREVVRDRHDDHVLRAKLLRHRLDLRLHAGGVAIDGVRLRELDVLALGLA